MLNNYLILHFAQVFIMEFKISDMKTHQDSY